MKILGIEFRKPSFNETTAATVLAIGLWLACLGASHASGIVLDRHDAGALLLVAFWGCIGVRLGLGFDKGSRHTAVHVGVATLLLGSYEAVTFVAMTV